MPISPMEAKRRAKLAAAEKAPIHEYAIKSDTAPGFKPDWHGGVGGVKTYFKGGKHHMMLSSRQAQYWLDQGVIHPTSPEHPINKAAAAATVKK